MHIIYAKILLRFEFGSSKFRADILSIQSLRHMMILFELEISLDRR